LLFEFFFDRVVSVAPVEASSPKSILGFAGSTGLGCGFGANSTARFAVNVTWSL
jgi:hypothetical protein